MRRLGASDLAVAAQALLALPEGARSAGMAKMLHEAEAADRYRKRLGRAHPLWGNGTLEAAARAHALEAPRPLADAEYLSCLGLVLQALVSHRASVRP